MEIQLVEKSGALKAALFIRNCDLKADKMLFPVIYKRKVGDMEGEKPSDGCGRLEPQRVPKKLVVDILTEDSGSGQSQATANEPGTTSKWGANTPPSSSESREVHICVVLQVLLVMVTIPSPV
jgi:hypothetical protein